MGLTYEEYKKVKRSYQEAGTLLLLEKKHACLFYKPGKGKTYPTIEALEEVCKTIKYPKVLILSTATSVNLMWNAEIVPQGILPPDTTIMSFNSAIVDKRSIELLNTRWDVIIVDECHKAKSHSSKTGKLLYKLCKRAEYVWGLTGTPRGNSDVDIYCQFHNLWISDWGYISYTRFVNECCDVNQMYIRGQQIKVPTGINERYITGWEKNVAMFTQRVDYDDEDDMPDLDVDVVEIDYEQSKTYKDAMVGVISMKDYETTMTKLVAIQKLHQICNGFLYYDESVAHFEHNNKLDWLRDNLTNEPTVIVYRFAEDLAMIQDTLTVPYTESVIDFKSGKANVLLLQCSRCESFNLQMCQKIIFYTLDYSYINYNQMIHRVWRMGQNEDVKITILLQKNSIEKSIWQAVQNKEILADLFMRIKGGY